jgi:hypothetical protein
MTLAPPEVICTHESDLDGLVSGLLLQRLARHLFLSDVQLEAFHYQAWKLRSMSEDVAWVADFAAEARFDRSHWLVLDHHQSEYRPRNAGFVHDLGKCAARLCYELCANHNLTTPKLDRLVHLTEVGDLFREDDPDFDLACDYGSLVKTYGFWNLHAVIGGDPERIVDHPLLEVMATRRRIEDPIGYELALKDVVELSPTVGLVKAPIGNSNLVVHHMLNRGATKYSVLATLYRRGAGVYVASFRSRGGEALKVATRFEGGGGHANASGASLPRMNDHDAAVSFLRQRLNPPNSRAAQGINSMAGAIETLQWPPT